MKINVQIGIATKQKMRVTKHLDLVESVWLVGVECEVCYGQGTGSIRKEHRCPFTDHWPPKLEPKKAESLNKGCLT